VNLPDWAHRRPSTTVVGSFRPDVIAGPGFRRAGGFSRQDAPGSVLTTVAQRAHLQSYPVGFNFRGAKGKIALQLGNAVPPAVAHAVLRHLWSPA
jgi:DNA (cytosine-5)-methyltransferase 1